MPIPHPTPTPIEGETPGSVANLPGCEAQEFVGELAQIASEENDVSRREGSGQ
jgi:hypothetical protein